MGTTPNGYPYPEDADQLNQGAQAIKALATAIDTQLKASAGGILSAPINNVSTYQATITFPVGRFKSIPTLVCTASTVSTWYSFTSVVTATSGQVGIRQYKDTLTTGTIPIHWQAREAS